MFRCPMFFPNDRKMRSSVLRALVLLVWLLGVPGLRPAYHHHQASTLSAAEASQLVEHLKNYEHSESQDTEKIHLHWLVQLDGGAIPAFPNSSPAFEHGLVFANPELDSAWEETQRFDDCCLVDFIFNLDCSVDLQPLSIAHRLDRHRESEVPKHSRFAAYTTTLYSAAYL